MVSQNLSNLLHFVLAHHMIPRFDSRLSNDFNQFMYIVNLLLITKASRQITHFCNTSLGVYTSITGQKQNLSKSANYSPHWFNKWIAKTINSIFKFKIGEYPFTYLSVSIDYRRLKMNTFQPMFYKITNLTTSWNFKSLAKDGKVVLINSYLMSSLPTGLSVYPIPDTTFDSISKLAKKFL